MAAAMNATRTTSGSTSNRSAKPAQTPPRIRRVGSRRSAVAELVAMRLSMLRAPAQADRDEDRPHRREGDGGEGGEAEVDRVRLVQQQDRPEPDQREPADQRGKVRPTHWRTPCSGPVPRR